MLEHFASMFSFKGRVNRISFVLHTLSSIAMVLGLGFAGVMSMVALPVTVILILPITLIVIVFYFITEAALIVRRLHDIGVSGTFFFLSFLLGPFFLLAMILIPGTKGHNSYGAPQGMTADDYLRQGLWLEQRRQYEAAFQNYAYVVEDDRFTTEDHDAAISCIERLRDHLQSKGIIEFNAV